MHFSHGPSFFEAAACFFAPVARTLRRARARHARMPSSARRNEGGGRGTDDQSHQYCDKKGCDNALRAALRVVFCSCLCFLRSSSSSFELLSHVHSALHVESCVFCRSWVACLPEGLRTEMFTICVSRGNHPKESPFSFDRWRCMKSIHALPTRCRAPCD